MMSDTTREELAFERAETEYRRGVRATIGILAVLCGLCVIASLSGCKITYRTLPECACERRDM